MAERCIYMVKFLRDLAVLILPLVLRLIANEVENTFDKGGEVE